MPTIIYPPSIPWNWMFQRPQQLLRQLSRFGYVILYEDLGNFTNGKVEPLFPDFFLCQGVSALTVPHPRPRILWLTVPSHIGLIEQYQPDLVIYDAVDEPKEEFAGWAPYYPEIIDKADLIFTSAQSIYDSLCTKHPHVCLVPNGVDYGHFSIPTSARPKDLPVGKTIIGYSGAIASWVDWDLLRSVITGNPDLAFVFIGTLFYLKKFPLNLPNSFYLGLKPYQELPAYLQNFDLGLIPFRLTDMTKGCNPIKLYEYYATGLPVLASPLPELLAVPHISLESDAGRFSHLVQQLSCTKEQGESERKLFAQKNDWGKRAAVIHSQIHLHLAISARE